VATEDVAVRYAAFAVQVQEICKVYKRPLTADEMVLCVTDMTSLHLRPRESAILPAEQNQPTGVEHEAVGVVR
jgi:hypothetical protein